MARLPIVGVQIVPEIPPPYAVGYTGHCPQYTYRVKKMYGTQSHKFFLEPRVAQHAMATRKYKTTICKHTEDLSTDENDKKLQEERLCVQETTEVIEETEERTKVGKGANATKDNDIKNNQGLNWGQYALCDFTAPLREPPPDIGIKPPPRDIHDLEEIDPSEIYHRCSGQIPNYTGHVPGYIFTVGQTFAHATTGPKRWLTGEII